MRGNKSGVRRKFFGNQRMREKDFQRSEIRYCLCSAFSFSAVGHVKKTPSWVKKNHAVISNSSLLVKIAAFRFNKILEITSEVSLQQGCQGQDCNFIKNLTSSPLFFKNLAKIISYHSNFFERQGQLSFRNNFR